MAKRNTRPVRVNADLYDEAKEMIEQLERKGMSMSLEDAYFKVRMRKTKKSDVFADFNNMWGFK